MANNNAIILDDHQLFAEAFAQMIRNSTLFETVRFTDDLAVIKQQVANSSVSHIFIDYIMPNVNTLMEIRNFKTQNKKIKIIVVSSISNPNLIWQLQKVGADGFISKAANKAEVLECLNYVETGKFYVNKALKEAMFNSMANGKKELITERELEILHYISAGATIEDTADKLCISKHTVVAHRRNIMEKMEVNSVSALMKKAMDLGLLN
jgi:two-component system, NarL family, response regulator FusR